MNQLATTRPAAAPAPLTHELETSLSVCMNHLDPDGMGCSIAAEDAPSRDLRQALDRHRQRLDACLAPIGKRGAAAEVMALSEILKSRGRNTKQAEIALDLYVDNLADLPAFAVIAACADYQQGRAGDREWMPEVPQLRVHALSKQRAAAVERARINRLLTARIRPPRASPERRAATLAMVRRAVEEMRRTAEPAPAERMMREPDVAPPEPETPEAALARLQAEIASRPVVLSRELRRHVHSSLGIDPTLWEDEQRLREEFEAQGERVA